MTQTIKTDKNIGKHAEMCAKELDRNDAEEFNRIFPYFFDSVLNALLSPSTSSDAVNDLAAILGLSILYGEYYDNKELSESVLKTFDLWADKSNVPQLSLEKMILVSNSAPARNEFDWMERFRNRAERDGYRGRDEDTLNHKSNIVNLVLSCGVLNANHLFFTVHVLPKLEGFDVKRAGDKIFLFKTELDKVSS